MPSVYHWTPEERAALDARLDAMEARATALELAQSRCACSYPPAALPTGPMQWDFDVRGEHLIAYEKGNRTVSTTTPAGIHGRIRSTFGYNSGKRYFEAIPTASMAPEWQEIIAGFVPDGWDRLYAGPMNDDNGNPLGGAAGIANDGMALITTPFVGDSQDTGHPADGLLRGWVDFNFGPHPEEPWRRIGKIWLGNAAGPFGDPEAGTGEICTFPAEMALWIGTSLYSGEGGRVGLELVPDATSGSFNAW